MENVDGPGFEIDGKRQSEEAETRTLEDEVWAKEQEDIKRVVQEAISESERAREDIETHVEEAARILQVMEVGLSQLEEKTKDLDVRIQGIQRLAKLRALVLTGAGTVASILLLWGASQTEGFWSLLLNALGTSLLAASVVAVAAYFVSRLWNIEDEARSRMVLWWTEYIARRIIDVSVKVDHNPEILDRLDTLIFEQRAQ